MNCNGSSSSCFSYSSIKSVPSNWISPSLFLSISPIINSISCYEVGLKMCPMLIEREVRRRPEDPGRNHKTKRAM